MGKVRQCWLVGLVTLAAGAAAQPRPACWLVLPDKGRAAALLREAPAHLRAAGFNVAAETSRAPAVIIAYPRAVQSEAELGVVRQMVAEGAGLVVVYSLAPDLEASTQALLALGEVGLQRVGASAGKLEVIEHPITAGVEKLFVWRVGARLENVQPLLRQGENVIAGCVSREGRRLVALPLDAVVPGEEQDSIPAVNMRLLVQAAQWAAQGAIVPPASEPSRQASEEAGAAPPESSPQAPLPRGSYRKLVYADLVAQDEDWPALREAVVQVVRQAGLGVEVARSASLAPQRPGKASRPSPAQPQEPASLPLLRALQENPALIVLGSCRPYSALEAVALASYLSAGGAALFLPRASHKTNQRLVWLNQMLSEFGMSANLDRRTGQPKPKAGPVGEVLANLGRVSAGIMVVGYHGEDWVTIGGHSVLRVASYGSGRLAVLDPLPLLAGKGDGSVAGTWQQLLGKLVSWLVEGMEWEK
jgi:hypothetical protein